MRSYYQGSDIRFNIYAEGLNLQEEDLTVLLYLSNLEIIIKKSEMIDLGAGVYQVLIPSIKTAAMPSGSYFIEVLIGGAKIDKNVLRDYGFNILQSRIKKEVL